MAAPVDAGRTVTNVATAATAHTVNLPASVASGDLLIVAMRFPAAPGTITFTGYTQRVLDTSDASDDTTAVYYRWADGTEGTTDPLSTANSVKAAFISWRITGAQNPSERLFDVSTVAVGTGANPDPGSVTPGGGTDDYLFIEVAGLDGETQTFTASTNYSNIQNANSGTGGAAASNCRLGGATRAITGTSAAENPGTMTAAAPSTGWTAWTFAIKAPNTPKAGTDSGSGSDSSSVVYTIAGTDSGGVPWPSTLEGPLGADDPGNVENGDVAWTTPYEITFDDGFYAEVSLPTANISHELRGKTLGAAISTSNTIRGIEVVLTDTEITGGLSGNVWLSKDSTTHAGDARTFLNQAGQQTLGGQNDLWGTTWTPAEINSINFSVLASIYNDLAGTQTGRIDRIHVNVYHSSANTAEFAVTASDSSAKSGTDSGSGSEVAKVNTWGTFESSDTSGGGIFPWLSYQGATLSRDTGTVHTGSGSLKVVTPGSVSTCEGAYVAGGYLDGFSPGNVVEFHTMVYAPNGVNFQIQVDEYDSGGSYLRSNITNFTGTGAWQQVINTPTLGASCAKIGAAVYTRYGETIAATFYVDEAVVASKRLPVTDSGSGTDASALVVQVTGTDSGAGAEGTSTLVVALPVTDTAAGTETASNFVRDGISDSGAGSDASTLAAAFVVTESGSGADTAIVGTATLTATDSGAGTDASTLVAVYSVTDSGAGTDASAMEAVYTASDSGTGVEGTSTLVVDLLATDIGAGVDTSALDTGGTAKAGTDDGVGTDASALVVAFADPLAGQNYGGQPWDYGDPIQSFASVSNSDWGAYPEWSNTSVTALQSQDGVAATVTVPANDLSEDLRVLNWGITAQGDRASQVYVEFYANLPEQQYNADLNVQLTRDGGSSGFASFAMGGPIHGHLTLRFNVGHLNLTRAQIESSNFGVLFYVDTNINQGTTCSIDWVKIGIKYEQESVTSFVRDGILDSGAGTELGSISLSAVDDGAGVDASTVVAVLATADTGSGADASTLVAAYALTDSGSGAEIVTDRGLYIEDSGVGTDSSSLIVDLQATDSGAGVDSGSAAVGGDELKAGSDSGTSTDEISAFHRFVHETIKVAENRNGGGSYAVSPQRGYWLPWGNADWTGIGTDPNDYPKALQDDFPYTTHKATVVVPAYGISDHLVVTYFPGLFDNFDGEWIDYATARWIPLYLSLGVGTVASQSGCYIEIRPTKNGIPFGNAKSVAIPSGTGAFSVEGDVNGSSWFGGTPWVAALTSISGGDLHDPNFGFDIQIWSNRSTDTTVDLTWLTLSTEVVPEPMTLGLYGTAGEKGALQYVGSDTGSGTDSAIVGVYGVDDGTGADTGTPTIVATDSGVGTESGFVSIIVSGSDTGSGADVSLLTALIGRTDVGSGTELISGMGMLGSDYATGVESLGARIFGAADLISGLDLGDADWALGVPAPLQSQTLTPAPLQTQTFGSVAVGSQTLTAAPLQTQTLTAAPLQDQDLNPIDYEPQ